MQRTGKTALVKLSIQSLRLSPRSLTRAAAARLESALREVSIATQVIPGRCTANSGDEHGRTPDATDRVHGLAGVPRYGVASRRGADLGP